MEFPDLGTHCSHSSCNRLDFLPFNCGECNKLYCVIHYKVDDHECSNPGKNNQVTVCPLCRAPISVKRGSPPDSAVSEHLDNFCQSNLASFKGTFLRCSRKDCRVKEVIYIVCIECNDNFCIKHRHPMDHSCSGCAKKTALTGQNNPSSNATKWGFRKVKRNKGGDNKALARDLTSSKGDSKRKTERTKSNRSGCCTIS